MYGAVAYNNIISQPVESYVQQYSAGVPKVTAAQQITINPSVLAPDTVYQLHQKDGISSFVPVYESGANVIRDSHYKRQLTINKFNHGNVVEQSDKDGIKEVLLWGYQHQFIVARVIGSDYATVRSLIDTTIVNNPSSDAALRATLANIRIGLASANPQAAVTTYTYAPLKGMTSMTDPKGETTFYAYDPFGRLKTKKDAEGAVQQTINYHYKP